MSRIVTEIYEAFRAANVSDELARAAAGAIAGREDLVTKLDLERAMSRVQSGIAELKADLELLKFAYGPLIIGWLVKIAFFP